MMWRLMIMALVLTGSTATICRAHGVDGTIAPARGFCVTVLYDDGEPMSYAAVEITPPDAGIGFQTGRTDRNGRFMFQPDGNGIWHVSVKDGMGHGVSLDLEVDTSNAQTEADRPGARRSAAGPSRGVGIIAGLSIIFGLSGFFYGWKARRTGGS